MLAEQALRKLAAAAKAGAMKAESRRRTSAPLAGVGRVRDGAGRKRAAPEMLFEDVLNDVTESNGGDYAMALDGADDRGRQPTQSELEERVVVNSGMGTWRRCGTWSALKRILRPVQKHERRALRVVKSSL